MKYVDLLEFCRLILATEADECMLRDYHVKPDGPIQAVFGKVYIAIREGRDFDFIKYLENNIDLHDDPNKPPANKLH